MIEVATRARQSELEALYNNCFPGEEEFCRWFFERLWQPENSLIYLQDGKVCAMLNMLPMQLVDGDESYDCAYFYALATHTDMRGKGIMAKLMQKAFEQCKQKEIKFITLIVQSEGLFYFYEKHGFERAFYISQNSCSPLPLPADKRIRAMTDADFEAVNDIYSAQMKGLIYGKRDKKYFDSMLEAYGKSSYVLTDVSGKVKAYAVGAFGAEQFMAVECFGEEAQTLMAAISFERGYDTALWHGAPTSKNRVPQGCILPLDSLKLDAETTYLNLMYN